MKNRHLRTRLGQIKGRADLIEKYLTGDYDCYTRCIDGGRWWLDDKVQFDAFDHMEYKLVKKDKWADLIEKYKTGDYDCFASMLEEDIWVLLDSPSFESEDLKYKLEPKNTNAKEPNKESGELLTELKKLIGKYE